jgi:superfamily I DNA/RNA helicase
MLQSSYEQLGPNTSRDLTNKIKQLLQSQRFAVRRAYSIGMSRDEAAEMEARINEIEKLLETLRGSE